MGALIVLNFFRVGGLLLLLRRPDEGSGSGGRCVNPCGCAQISHYGSIGAVWTDLNYSCIVLIVSNADKLCVHKTHAKLWVLPFVRKGPIFKFWNLHNCFLFD